MPARYDAVVDLYAGGPDDVTTPAAAALLDLTGPVDGRRVLDLACGHGVIARELARRGATVVGVDLSDGLLDRARRTEAAEPFGIRYLPGDAADDALLVDERFDVVTCNFGLSDIDDLDGTLGTVARVLDPGGRFVFSILHPCFGGDDLGSGTWPTDGTYYDEGWWRALGALSTLRREVGANHRTLSTYVNALVAHGLAIDALAEPRPEASWTTERPVAAAQPVYLAGALPTGVAVTISAASLTEVLSAAAGEHHVPGAAAGVLVGDEAITATWGITSAEHPTPITSSTLFQVGSVSKTVTSAAVMLLVQDERVALDDPIARHLPDLGPATGLDTAAMTVEHILSHQGGFDGDHLFVEQTNDLAALASARRFFEPGQGFSYNNAGFSIAGAVIEAVSGQRFETFVRDRLFRPLGMRSACFTADEAITRPVALPHWVHDGTAHVLRHVGWQPGWEVIPADRPAGGMIASVDDLLRWSSFQWSGTDDAGAELLSAASLTQLHTPVVRSNPVEEIGLDWFVETIDGATAIGHGGVTAGYVTDLLVVPAARFAFVGLTNATNGASVNEAVRRWALETGPGLVERDPEPDPAFGATVDGGRLVGRYLHSFAAIDVTTGSEPGTVVLTSSARDDIDGWQPPLDDPITFAFVQPGFAVSIDAPGPVRTLCFPTDDGPSAAWLNLNGRRAPRIG